MYSELRKACFALGIICGVLLFFWRVRLKGHGTPAWAANTLALMGFVAIAWSVLGFTSNYGSVHFEVNTVNVLNHYRSLLAGIGIGLFLALWISGALAHLCRKQNEKGQ
jgi:uncharacterized membrane protein